MRRRRENPVKGKEYKEQKQVWRVFRRRCWSDTLKGEKEGGRLGSATLRLSQAGPVSTRAPEQRPPAW